ncbi:preprotein translocase subunit SecE [Terriglobus aquaticus]|uniref:Protein translocase subunit SecE n=1 Tax=Terriglobus aquaticus TaxID=940139 RepID=A0ABW9KMM4_9BACT|nr:preprotein translocase subunit SecE [Terriglobus aquaticus]
MAKAMVVADQPTTGIERMKSGPERLKSFLEDVRSELRKVNTPTQAEVRSTTTVVILTVFAFAAFFWLVDLLINHTLNALITRLTTH